MQVSRWRLEERMLLRAFPEEYARYMQRTGAFCPLPIPCCRVLDHEEEQRLLGVNAEA